MTTRPADLPEAFWDVEKNTVNAAKINELVVRDAANESRRLALPQKAEDVKLDLPADFKLPTGVDFKFDPAKPEYNKFRELVVSEGLSQDTATKLTGLFAEIMVGDQASMQQFEAAEVAKLGPNGPARKTAVDIGIEAAFGPTHANFVKVMNRTAGGVQFLEAVLGKIVSQGVATFSQGGREPSNPQGRVNDEQWAKMPAAERLDYNRRFPQDQMPAWRDPRAA